jgi:hypothetical protein
MESITKEQFSEICRNSYVLQADGFGAKVLRLADGQMVKIFRRKRLLSSALFRPYARRFQKNAVRLTERGIRTVEVVRICRCPSQARHLVFYQPVPGTTLRDFLNAKSANLYILEDFAEFLAELHIKGIYFRSIHFGNVIVLPDSAGFALIDIADLSFHSDSLDFKLRLRNFRHFLRYGEDRKSLERFGSARFVNIFAKTAGCSETQKKTLQNKISLAINS